MQEFYCAFKQIEEGRKKILIPILLEDLTLDNIGYIDQDHLAVLRQYLRTYTYMDGRNYKRSIAELRKRILFELPAIPLSKMAIKDDNDLNDNDQTLLLGAEASCTATAEPAL